MQDYRVFVIGGDGKITQAIELVSSDDEAALAASRELIDGRAIELWQGARRVASLSGESNEGD